VWSALCVRPLSGVFCSVCSDLGVSRNPEVAATDHGIDLARPGVSKHLPQHPPAKLCNLPSELPVRCDGLLHGESSCRQPAISFPLVLALHSQLHKPWIAWCACSDGQAASERPRPSGK